MSLYGTEASYEDHVNKKTWVTKDWNTCEDLTDFLESRDILVAAQSKDKPYRDMSYAHPIELLPKSFAGLPNGHGGSHQFLVHEFVTCCVSGMTPLNNVWAAARYLVPGLVGHESAIKGGKLMVVPDFGDPPATARLWDLGASLL